MIVFFLIIDFYFSLFFMKLIGDFSAVFRLNGLSFREKQAYVAHILHILCHLCLPLSIIWLPHTLGISSTACRAVQPSE